ncbi:hypothetical protein [Elizabethkingia meningoseptica]|uniref:hypothetical protein n=1 Tax=Elizabethkingia meningoseptica TaxID=238 RepID=UPI001624E352|nr:hypothetical protein [Elizabethkingia meningoseptica]MBG0514076.1 hypothetical protein [Elizabethkingia meningoseptica]
MDSLSNRLKSSFKEEKSMVQIFEELNKEIEMENKLIPMTDFVINSNEKRMSSNPYNERDYDNDFICEVVEYAKFLKQPLALWMFVPCDENNVPLMKPDYLGGETSKRWNDYDYAKSRVLFEGFRIVDFEEHQIESLKHTSYLQWDDIDLISKKDWEEEWYFEDYTVEFLLTEPTAEITLTETAIKQIYGS